MNTSDFSKAQETMHAHGLLRRLRHDLDRSQVVHLAVVDEDSGAIDYYGIDARDYPALHAMLREEEQRNRGELEKLGVTVDTPACKGSLASATPQTSDCVHEPGGFNSASNDGRGT